MRRLVIALDWDDSLVDYNQGFVDYHNVHHGTCVKYEDIHTHEMKLMWNCEEAVIVERTATFRKSEGFGRLLPMPGAREAVTYLRQFHDLHIVTNRAESFREATLADAVRHFDNPFAGMHFANGFGADPGMPKRPKSAPCKAIGASVLIEDAPSHAREVAACGIPVLMLDRPWNRKETPPGVTRVRSWEEAVRWIDRHAHQ